MKYFLLVMLALAGCSHANYSSNYPGKPMYPEPPSTNQVDIQFNDKADVSFVCFQDDVTPDLVWDQCNFHNFARQPKSACIQVSYNNGKTEVVRSRTICSGPIEPGGNQGGFAAFTNKNGRQALEQACGTNMVNCQLKVQEIR